jgi:hypothetical protein
MEFCKESKQIIMIQLSFPKQLCKQFFVIVHII